MVFRHGGQIEILAVTKYFFMPACLIRGCCRTSRCRNHRMFGRRLRDLHLFRHLTTSICVIGVWAASTLTWAEPAPATLPVAIELHAQARLLPTNPKLLGSNTPWVYGSEGLLDDAGQWRPAMLARAREWSPPVLRYPGGEPADSYRWRQGVGPMAERPAVLAYEGQPLQRIVYGTQEFLETCEALGSTPLIVVNMHTGNDAEVARQAADWVRYTTGQTLISRKTGKPLPKVRDWELGNEPYLMDSRRADGRANPMFLRPAQFAQRVNLVMAAMREADPGLRIGLPFALDTLSGRPWRSGGEPATVVGDQLGYADKLLSRLDRPQDVSFLALHYYMPLVGAVSAESLQRLPSDEALYWGAVAGSEVLRRHLTQVTDFWAQHPRTRGLPLPRLQVTEFNSFFTNGVVQGKEPRQNAYVATQAGALFVADLIRVMSGNAQVEAATQWSLNGNWVFGAIAAPTGSAPEPVRPVFQVMRLARALLAAGGQHVQLSVVAPTRPGATPQVGFAAPYPDMPLATALASRHGQTVQVMVINKDPSRSAAVTVALADAQARQATVEQLQSAGVFASPDTPQASSLVQPKVSVDREGRQAQWTLGPASVALLTLRLR